MIQKVLVTNFKDETLTLELTHPEDSGLVIYNIEGIGGGQSSINTTDITNGDGSLFNSARAQSRNIVLSAKLIPTDTLQSIEEVRHNIVYKYFPIKKSLRLTFITDKRRMYIDGYVESNDVPIFSSEEYTQVSIICPDPYFYSIDEPTTAFAGAIPMFEFPFCDDSLTEPPPPPPPPEHWEDNMVTNFNLREPTNTKGERQYTNTGETIDGWFFENESPGNANVTVNSGNVTVRNYSTNTYSVKFYNIFGSLVSGQSYLASYLDSEGVHTTVLAIERPDLAVAYEQTLAETDNHKIQVLADSGSALYRFQVTINAEVNDAVELEAVKVEPGSDPDTQTLAKLIDGEWIISTKPVVPQPEPEVVTPTLEFGELVIDARATIYYDGSADTGMQISMLFSGEVGETITIYDVTTEEKFILNQTRIASIIGRNIRSGDRIEIYTYRGAKRALLFTDLNQYNIIGAMDKFSKWFVLTPGDNIFQVDASSGLDKITTTFTYNTSYMGV